MPNNVSLGDAVPLSPGGCHICPKGAASGDGAYKNEQAWATWRMAFRTLKWPRTVIVFNLGLHFHDPAMLRFALAQWAQAFGEAVQTKRLSGAVLYETTAQHFPSKKGLYEAERDRTALPPIDGYPCAPVLSLSNAEDGTGGGISMTNTFAHCTNLTWRSAIIHEEAVRAAIPVARFEKVTEPFFDLHVGFNRHGNGDCSHYCYSPGMVEALAFELALKIT